MSTTPEEAREVVVDEILQRLYIDPAYGEMVSACKEQMEKEFRRMAIRLASGEDVPDKDIWWLRGWYACLKQFLDSPKTADARVKRNRGEE